MRTPTSPPTTITKIHHFLKFITITTTCLIITTTIKPVDSSQDDLIDQICQKTPFYTLCVTTLRSTTPPPTTILDVKGIATLMSNLILSDATKTLNYIEAQIKQAKDPEAEEALANCAELYIPVVKYNLPQAIDALSKGRYGFANYVISDASNQALACQKGLTLSGFPDSVLSDRNQLVGDLCDVAVSIINLLSNKF